MSRDRDDIESWYFIVNTEPNGTKRIVAWSEKKRMAECYLKFYSSPNHELKKITKTLGELEKLRDENIQDEIDIININTRNRKKGRNDEMKMIAIPATNSETAIISEEANTFFSGRIGYAYINERLPYLKNKYREALEILFLDSIIRKVIHNKSDKKADQIELDQLMILFKSFSSSFG